MPSLYDEKSARQRARLRSLFAAPPPTVPPPEVPPPGGLYGPEAGARDPRGSARDQASFPSISAMFNDPGFRGDWGKVAAMMSPGMSLARDLITGNDPINGNAGMGAASTGMNVAGGVANPELAGRSDPSQGGADIFGGRDLDLAGSIGESPGLYRKGGRVKKQGLFNIDPPGPDNVVIGAKTGERIITDDDYAAFSKETKAEVDAAMKKAEARRKKR